MASRGDDLLLDAPRRDPRPVVKFRAVLDGTWRAFRLAYNSRSQLWTVDVYTDPGAAVALGLVALPGVDILGAVHCLADVPPGQLFVEDTAGQDRPPNRTGFQTYARLYYRPLSVVALAAGTEDEIR